MTSQRERIFTYHPDGLPLIEPVLVGSWDDEGSLDKNWTGQGIAMAERTDGSWQVAMTLIGESGDEFWWGVKDRGEWMMFGQTALSFFPFDDLEDPSFELGHRWRLGLHKRGRGFRAEVWAPHARGVELVVGEETWSMTKDQGYWSMSTSKGWSDIVGQPYGYLVTTSEGHRVLRADPYSRERQGPQQGVSDLFVSKLGEERHRYNLERVDHHLLRFECVPIAKTLPTAPILRFFDSKGKALTKAQLKSHSISQPTLPAWESWWFDKVDEKGQIPLTRREDCEAYATVIGPADLLLGLQYTITDSDGETYHDPWDNTLADAHNWPRLGLVEPELKPIEQAENKPQDLVIYETHIGSICGAGGNLKTSTLSDLGQKLGAIKKMGFNTIALMPTNCTEGHRDWGYLGTSGMAHHAPYADPGQSCQKSLQTFVKKCHRLGLLVFTDVVYNHVGGEHNDLWEFDGAKNPWFETHINPTPLGDLLVQPTVPNKTSDAVAQTHENSVENTPWGPIPAYPKRPVSQFYIDHAIDQVHRFGFDGIRFDFTNLIHSSSGGGQAGWKLLREINWRLHHFFPKTLTFAEEFPPHPIITTPVNDGGAGFDGMWNTEHQHRLVFDHHRQSVTQAVVEGAEPNLAHLLAHILHPQGFANPHSSATVLSNHDEVGNAQRLWNLVQTHPRATDIARLVSWFSLLCPGYPILFQGTEDLAPNFFSWGLPSTWDSHSPSQTLPSTSLREQHRKGIAKVLKFRAKHSELWASSGVVDHYIKEREVLALKRGKLWIVANFSLQTQSVDLAVHPKALLSSECLGYRGTPTRKNKVGSLALKIFAAENPEA